MRSDSSKRSPRSTRPSTPRKRSRRPEEVAAILRAAGLDDERLRCSLAAPLYGLLTGCDPPGEGGAPEADRRASRHPAPLARSVDEHEQRLSLLDDVGGELG